MSPEGFRKVRCCSQQLMLSLYDYVVSLKYSLSDFNISVVLCPDNNFLFDISVPEVNKNKTSAAIFKNSA